jgi:hypothetical protein
VGIITGLLRDYNMNVFPTFENYVEQFKIFVEGLPKGVQSSILPMIKK